MTKEGQEVKASEQREKYYKVRFSAKSSANDTDDVELSVNGETLIIAREKEVVVPERFLECARHATVEKFRQLPNKPRKVVAKLEVYPYAVMGEATEQDFINQKREGTETVKRNVALHGFDVTPEMLE